MITSIKDFWLIQTDWVLSTHSWSLTFSAALEMMTFWKRNSFQNFRPESLIMLQLAESYARTPTFPLQLSIKQTALVIVWRLMVESLSAEAYDTSNITPLSMAYTMRNAVNTHKQGSKPGNLEWGSHPVYGRSLEEEGKFLCHRDANDVNVTQHAGGLSQTHSVTMHYSIKTTRVLLAQREGFQHWCFQTDGGPEGESRDTS